MDSFEKEINTTFLKLNIPFVEYGITSSDSVSLEGIFRNPEFPNLSQNRNQLFRMASMTKPITAYLTLAVLEDNGIDLHDSIGKYVPEIDDLEIAISLSLLLDAQKHLDEPLQNAIGQFIREVNPSVEAIHQKIS